LPAIGGKRDAVDLVEQVGASDIFLTWITNWGTFSANEYREKSVFLTGHPQHGELLEAMQDPRLSAAVGHLG
jgi:hypothetical protein